MWYELFHKVSKMVLPLLKEFKEKHTGVPGVLYAELNVDTSVEHDSPQDQAIRETWNEILDSMIEAHRLIVEEDGDWPFDEKKADQVKQGLAHFAKYYTNLWD
jgi:hypothetical protein